MTVNWEKSRNDDSLLDAHWKGSQQINVNGGRFFYVKQGDRIHILKNDATDSMTIKLTGTLAGGMDIANARFGKRSLEDFVRQALNTNDQSHQISNVQHNIKLFTKDSLWNKIKRLFGSHDGLHNNVNFVFHAVHAPSPEVQEQATEAVDERINQLLEEGHRTQTNKLPDVFMVLTNLINDQDLINRRAALQAATRFLYGLLELDDNRDFLNGVQELLKPLTDDINPLLEAMKKYGDRHQSLLAWDISNAIK